MFTIVQDQEQTIVAYQSGQALGRRRTPLSLQADYISRDYRYQAWIDKRGQLHKPNASIKSRQEAARKFDRERRFADATRARQSDNTIGRARFPEELERAGPADNIVFGGGQVR